MGQGTRTATFPSINVEIDEVKGLLLRVWRDED